MSHAPHLQASTGETAQHPSRMSIRELITELSAIEDRLRHLPTFAPFGGRLVVHPERRLLLRHQRLVIAHLRRRGARPPTPPARPPGKQAPARGGQAPPPRTTTRHPPGAPGRR